MNAERTFQAGADNRTMQELRAQLAQYLAQQSEAKQLFHKLMKVLEMAGLAIVASAFVVAMYVSINHTAVPPMAIATAWFAFPVSAAPLMILLGLHAIVLRAFPPVVLPGKPQQFVTGSRAVWSGSRLIVTALAVVVFWGMVAWAVWSANTTLITALVQVLATMLGIGIAVSIVLSIFQKLVRSW